MINFSHYAITTFNIKKVFVDKEGQKSSSEGTFYAEESFAHNEQSCVKELLSIIFICGHEDCVRLYAITCYGYLRTYQTCISTENESWRTQILLDWTFSVNKSIMFILEVNDMANFHVFFRNALFLVLQSENILWCSIR